MPTNLHPTSGLCNPNSGSGFPYPANPMGRQAKAPKPPSLLVAIAARNCRRLLDYTYPQLAGQITRQIERLQEDRKIPKTTMQRWTNGEGGNLSKLEDVAAAFGLSGYQLLLPNLDVARYQVVEGATQEEHRLGKLFQRGDDIIKTQSAGAEMAQRRQSHNRP